MAKMSDQKIQMVMKIFCASSLLIVNQQSLHIIRTFYLSLEDLSYYYNLSFSGCQLSLYKVDSYCSADC